MISRRLHAHFYDDPKFNGTLVFYGWLRKHIAPHHRVLNLGAGPTPDQKLRSLRSEVQEVVGADIDEAVLKNSEVDQAVIIKNDRIELESASFDIAYSDYVLEHVEYPTRFLAEVNRLLKPGGSFFFRTPNIYHYVGALAALTPHAFHKAIANRVRGLSVEAHEPWPTYYRMNSKSKLMRLARATRFDNVELRMIEPNPSYLEFHALPFLAGVAYERLVNSSEYLSGIRCNIFGRFSRFSADKDGYSA